MTSTSAQEESVVAQRFGSWLEKHLSQQQLVVVLSFFIGIFTACAAYFLRRFIAWIQSLLTAGFDITNANWLFLVYPVVGIFLTALFIKYVVRDNISHGVTRILYAISRRQSHLKRHNCWSSLIASGITIGFGGSVGAEAPIVLTGSAIGSNLGQIFKLDHKSVMVLLGAGASGAIAGIFKAPIAGVVFTLEVLMIDLTMSSLIPLLVSSITASLVTYMLMGTSSEFNFSLESAFTVERVPTSILLGLFCGFISLYFTRVMNACESVFQKVKGMYGKLALGAVVLSLLIYLFPPLYGEGYSTITLLLNGKGMGDWESVMNNSMFYGDPDMLLVYLALIILVKVFASSATNGGGGCGGIFAPCLFLGCISGFVFSRFWNLHQLGVYAPEKNYALLGMAGVMSGVMHAPLTSIFLIAELTGGYFLFAPLMIVSLVSYLVIIIFEPNSVYATRLAKKGQLLTHHKDKAALTLMSLETILEKHDTRIAPEMKLGDLVLLVARERVNVFPVTDAGNRLLGVIDLQKIRKVLFRQELYNQFTASQLMEEPPARLSIDDPVTVVMDTMEQTHADTLPVVNNRGEYVGFVSRTTLYAMYRQVMVDFSEE
jgi:chloride channel protein, CIC family